jgi:sialate O-acetylesterase
MDIVWVNGKKIGATKKYGNWNKPRVYNIPASVTNVGPNVITVYVVDTGGGGGMWGKPEQMIVKPAGAEDKTAATLKGKWGYKIGLDAKDIPPQPKSSSGFNAHTPTSLYNGMIAPLIPYAIQGAVWYQGESNASRAYQYRTLFPIMIKNWRNDWARGDFPFYFVQIAPYLNQNPEIREAQLLTYRKVSNTGIVVTTDIGNIHDIHPKNKQDVGKRLALWALAKTYGNKDIVYSGPLYKSMKVEGEKIRLFFAYADGGLIAKDGALTHFIIAGEDKKFVEAKAVIDGDTIVVQSDKVKNPVAVRFGWENTAEPNLFNKAQLPASPFRTDNRTGETINPA